MAGRLGNKKITTQNLLILKVDAKNNLLIVKGSVPGHKGCMVRVVDAIKKDQDIKISDEVKQNNSDLLNAMTLIAKTGKGPSEQIPSMGCNIKWFKN